MQYPFKKPFLVALLGIVGLTLAAKAISPYHNTELTKSASVSVAAPAPSPAPVAERASGGALNAAALYSEMSLADAGLNATAFDFAITGFEKLVNSGKVKNDEIITIVDFSQPSTKKRLYVIDLEQKEVLFQSVVSHGRNTGTLWAKSFSNQNGSYQSSPGFYVTAETYMGGNGYSLRLDGMERHINDNARERAIVMHGAPYANESSIRSLGFLGRSQGCPALPQTLTKPVINTIKGGTVLFIYTEEGKYADRSSFV